jgi:hypothetical protein
LLLHNKSSKSKEPEPTTRPPHPNPRHVRHPGTTTTTTPTPTLAQPTHLHPTHSIKPANPAPQPPLTTFHPPTPSRRLLLPPRAIATLQVWHLLTPLLHMDPLRATLHAQRPALQRVELLSPARQRQRRRQRHVREVARELDARTRPGVGLCCTGNADAEQTASRGGG